MASCLILAPFPLARPRHGGQTHAANILQAGRRAGWHMESVSIFPADSFPSDEWGAFDIALDSAALSERVASDMPFADFHVARAAAGDDQVVQRLRGLILRFMPDIIQVEHPWGWLVLQKALPSTKKIPIVYSSHNIEWRAREPLFQLGLKNATSDNMLAATRLLEEELARTADLVFSISEREAREIEQVAGRPVVYLPAVSDLALPQSRLGSTRFSTEARLTSCCYAALMGSNYWPNVEGFFALFPDGLGFLRQGEQIWMAGALGDAIVNDPRYSTFFSINETRSRNVGYLDVAEKADFFATASCVIVPVTFGAGAKLKTADAIASGQPVIATSHAVDGYRPIVERAAGQGIYIADTPAEFRAWIRRALREKLPGCTIDVRAMLSPEAMTHSWSTHLGNLLAGH